MGRPRKIQQRDKDRGLPLSGRIRFLRLARKLTQAQLSEISGVHLNSIRAIETEKRPNASFATLSKLAIAMGCTIEISILPDKRGNGPLRLDYNHLTRGGRLSPRPRHRTPEELRDIIEDIDNMARVYHQKRKPPPPTKRITLDSE